MDSDYSSAVMQAELVVAAAANPNPPCVPWCTTSHSLEEFANGEGLLICSRPIGEATMPATGPGRRGALWEVSVESGWRTVDPEDLQSPMEQLEPRVWFSELDDLGASQAAAFAVAVATAAAFCEQVSEKQP